MLEVNEEAAVRLHEALSAPRAEELTRLPQAMQLVQALCRGEQGAAVQSVLVELSVTLERQVAAGALVHHLAAARQDGIFPTVLLPNRHGNPVAAGEVLRGRLLGEDGVAPLTTRLLKQAVINAAHIGDDGAARDAYVLARLRTIRGRCLSELRYSVLSVQEALQGLVSRTTNAASHLLNHLLAAKQQAEWQQAVLIKMRTSDEALTSHDLLIIQLPRLTELVQGMMVAAAGDADAFEREVKLYVARQLPLKEFVNAYDAVSPTAGRLWRRVEETAATSKEGSEVLLKSVRAVITRQFEDMELLRQPRNFEISELVATVYKEIAASIDAVESDVKTWASALHVMETHLRAVTYSTTTSVR